MKRLKKVILPLIVVGMLALDSTSVFASKNDIDVKTEQSTQVETRETKLKLNAKSLRDSGRDWYQNKGFNYARVHVKNNRNEKLTVTISNVDSDIGTFTVSPNSSSTQVYKNISSGVIYTASFVTPSGALDGDISVRISDKNDL